MKPFTQSRIATLLVTSFLALSAGACDTADAGASESTTFRPGGWGSGTLNTSNWVSAASRDMYESNRNGMWHTNSFGFETRLAEISFDHPTEGVVSSDPADGATPGVPRVKITNSNSLEVKFIPASGPSETFDGADLVGLELAFEVKYQGSSIYVSKVRFLAHESVSGGSLYEIHKINPIDDTLIAPICETSTNNDRFAAVFGNISINAQNGTVSETSNVLHIACTSAAPGKAPMFGYFPQGSTESFRLANRVLRADYCADGYPYTYPGNSLEIRDNFTPGNEGTTLADVYGSLGDMELEAMWDVHGILCMDTPRVSTLDRIDVACPVKVNGLDVDYNWRPPPCDTFVDPDPTAMRFFSLTDPDA